MKRKIYVVGFAFNPSLNAVALIAKTNQHNAEGDPRPEWIANKYNGIGTDLREGEEPIAGMIRTFKARTGVDTTESDWLNYTQIENSSAVVLFYKSTFNIDMWTAINTNGSEIVHKCNVHQLWVTPVVDNLKWLIPMAICESHNYSMSIDEREFPQLENNDPIILGKYFSEGNIYKEFQQFMQQTERHLDPANIELMKKSSNTAPGIMNYMVAPGIINPLMQHPFSAMKITGAHLVKSLIDLANTGDGPAVESPLRLQITFVNNDGDITIQDISEIELTDDVEVNVCGQDDISDLILELAKQVLEIGSKSQTLAAFLCCKLADVVALQVGAREFIEQEGDTPENWERVKAMLQSKLTGIASNTEGVENSSGSEGTPGGTPENKSEGVGEKSTVTFPGDGTAVVAGEPEEVTLPDLNKDTVAKEGQDPIGENKEKQSE